MERLLKLMKYKIMDLHILWLIQLEMKKNDNEINIHTRLYFILEGRIAFMGLVRMHPSKDNKYSGKYVIGRMNDTPSLALFNKGAYKYAIVGATPNFINWNINPFEVKS